MRTARLLLVAASLLVSGCAGRAHPDTNSPRDPRLIRLDEIQSAGSQGVGNVYDLVNRLHSEWLRPTPAGVNGAFLEPTVWIDGQRMGGLAVLRSTPLGTVTQIRYMTPSEAQGQLGLNNLGGAIVMTTSR